MFITSAVFLVPEATPSTPTITLGDRNWMVCHPDEIICANMQLIAISHHMQSI